MNLTTEIKLSKYQEIEGWLLKELSSGRFQLGELFYSEQELADKFHVTKLTIRQAYRNLEENAYIVRRRGKGTFVNKLPSQPCNIKIFRHCIIGVLTSGMNMEHDFKLGCILVESHQAAAREGYLLMLAHNDPSQLIEAGVDGIVVIGAQSPETLRKLMSSGIPAVNYPSADNLLPTPRINYREAAELLCRLFHSGKHRHLAFVGNDSDACMVRQKMENDLKNAAGEYGIAFSSLICDNGEFRQRLHALLSMAERPDALFVANSWCLSELNAVLKECGLKCPRDLSIIVHGSNAAIIPAIPPYSYFEVDISRCICTLFGMLFRQIRATEEEAAEEICHYHAALRGTVVARNGAGELPSSLVDNNAFISL